MASTDAVVVGLLGVAILVLGGAIASGRLWLLANYDPDRVEDRHRVARLAGGAVVAFGLLTLVLAWGLRTGVAGDWWWTGWALTALVLGGATAIVASGRH